MRKSRDILEFFGHLYFKIIQMANLKFSEAKLSNWNFQFRESGLATSEQIDAIADECKLFRAPTIIFNSTELLIKDKDERISITYNAREALRFINYEVREKNYYPLGPAEGQINTISFIPPKLFVKHAEHWKSIEKPKDIQITQIKESSDSFFLNSFKGLALGKHLKVERVNETVIPLEKLGPNNPITGYQQASFYEDELDDNGLIQYQYKFRTMANSWFGLIRNYARIDGVTVIIFDTRLYWEEGWNKVGRQFMVKRTSWDELTKNEAELPAGWRMNPNQSHLIYQFLKEQFVQNEYIYYG